MSHFSCHVLRTLRNMLVPAPASMANTRPAYSGQPLSENEEPVCLYSYSDQPQQTVALNPDLAAASLRHAPSRWAYSAETLAYLRNVAQEKGKTKGHAKGKQFL